MAKRLEEIEAQKKALKEKAAAEIAAVKKMLADKTAFLKAAERRIRAQSVKEKKKRDDHAKILLGVAMIWKCQTSPEYAKESRKLLDEFYKEAPERREDSEYGLTITVKRPESDTQRDDE
jgi:hypothetical protein